MIMKYLSGGAPKVVLALSSKIVNGCSYVDINNETTSIHVESLFPIRKFNIVSIQWTRENRQVEMIFLIDYWKRILLCALPGEKEISTISADEMETEIERVEERLLEIANILKL